MALPIFSEIDLALTNEALAQFTSGLQNRGLADPVQQFVTEAVQTVADFTAAYDLPLDRWRRLMRPIAICLIHETIGEGTPDSVIKARDVAMAELAAIRDGRFPNLISATVPVQEINARPGKWGSATRIEPR